MIGWGRRTAAVAVVVWVVLVSQALAQQDVLDDLHAERAKYGPTMSDDECAELVNAVAWKHRAEGWGLSGKTFGTRGVLYDGTQVAHDILHHRPTNLLYDVLISAGAASTVVRELRTVGPPIGDRPWVAPIAPRGQPTPPQGPFPGGVWEAKHAEVLLRFGPSATTRTVAEQLAFLWPAEGWGQKSAGPSRPVSENVIARRYSDGRMVGFQVVPATAHPMQFDLAGQQFVPVAGVDHLGLGGRPPDPGPGPDPDPDPDPPPEPPPAAQDWQALLTAIEALAAKVDALQATVYGFGDSTLPVLARIEQALDAQPTTPAGPWPQYVGSILGRTVVLTPRAQP